jgi:succinate dehydrogenase / fumarate reductase flavoprotein subunit/fumarate reductase flavoprotein subunit
MGLGTAIGRLQELAEQVGALRAPGGRVFNIAWQDVLNLRNQLLVCETIARSALARQESRGSHFRSDFPRSDDRVNTIFVRSSAKEGMELWQRTVEFSRMRPETVRLPLNDRHALATTGE